MGYFELQVNTTGANGSATGSNTSTTIARGILHAVSITYNSAPATTDVVIKEVGGLGRTLLTVSASNTNAVYHPTVPLSTNAGVANTGDSIVQPLLYDVKLMVEVGDSNALSPAVTVVMEVF